MTIDEGNPVGELPRSRRTRVIGAALLRAIGATILVVAIYFLAPMDRTLGPRTVIGIILALLAVFTIIGWQVWTITRSQYPIIRAVETLGLIVPLYVLLFATIYFLMDHANRATFGNTVSRIEAMYFSATVFTTVGFGDITAKTDAARVVVTIQMMLDLVIIGLVARVIINAIKIGQRRQPPAA